ncbi:MAG: class D sortase [Alkalibacterium sp.]
MKALANLFIVVGLALLGWFGYTLYEQEQMQSVTIEQAEVAIEKLRTESVAADSPDFEEEVRNFSPEMHEAFGILHVPKLERSIGVVEGTDPDALDKGVGHMSSTVLPGQGEQIIFSGHRDTVFKNFANLNLGDTFVVEMPYGDYTYEIRDTDIVDADDTSVVGEMGEEVLVVSTCYPFDYLGNAPERFVFYAYPVLE